MEVQTENIGHIGGYQIVQHAFIPDNPVSWILIIHGLGEYGLHYKQWAEQFSEAGIACFLLDLPGHGHSSGIPGDIKKFKHFEASVELAVSKAYQQIGKKGYALAHSLGGTVLLSFLNNYRPAHVLRAFILSPWLKLVQEIPLWKKVLARGMYYLFPSLTFKRAIGSSTPRTEMLGKKRGHDRISSRLFFSAAWKGESLFKRVRRFSLPVHFFHGRGDTLTHAQVTEKLVENLESPKSFKGYETDVHELYNSPFQSEIFEEVCKVILTTEQEQPKSTSPLESNGNEKDHNS